MSSRLTSILLSSLLMLPLSFNATAADPSQDLTTLHHMRLAAQKTLCDFFMFNGMEGDQRYAKQIKVSEDQVNAALQELQDLSGEGSKALQNQLQQQWLAYQEELKALITALETEGFTDLQPIADLAKRNQQLLVLSGELYGKIQQESSTSVPPLTERSRELGLLMQSISVNYASRNASVGGTFIGGSGGEDEKPIDELATDFQTRLAELKASPRNTPEIKASLQSVQTKWNYIEKSLKNYNENSVPFLISKYSEQIISGLEKTSELYAAGKL